MKQLTLILLAVFVALPLLGAEQNLAMERKIAEWEVEIASTKDWLRNGQYKKADRVISATIDEVCNTLTGGEEAARMIGLLLTLRALAEAGTGDEQQAVWSWQLAQQFEPALAQANLTEFGPPSELLSGYRLKPVEESEDFEPPGTQEAAEEMTAPKIRRAPIKFPKGALWSKQAGAVQVMVAIDEKGEISDPRIRESLPNPALTLTALEAMRAWRVKPALLNGEPTPIHYILTVNYTPR